MLVRGELGTRYCQRKNRNCIHRPSFDKPSPPDRLADPEPRARLTRCLARIMTDNWGASLGWPSIQSFEKGLVIHAARRRFIRDDPGSRRPVGKSAVLMKKTRLG